MLLYQLASCASLGFCLSVKAQIPLCRLTRDVPVDLSATSPISQFPRRKRACCGVADLSRGDGLTPRKFPRDTCHGEVAGKSA